MTSNKEKVLDLYPSAKCYHMEYMGAFYFVVYDSTSIRHYKKSELKAWKSAYKQIKKSDDKQGALQKILSILQVHVQ